MPLTLAIRVETNGPQGIAIFPGRTTRWEKKGGFGLVLPDRGCVSWTVSQSYNSLPDHLAGETGAEAKMVNEGQKHTLTRVPLATRVSCSLFKPKSQDSTLNADLGWVRSPNLFICPSSHCSH